MFIKIVFLLLPTLVLAKSDCPSNPDKYIVFIDNCPSDEANINIKPVGKACIKKTNHSDKVLKTYKSAGGKRKIILVSYHYGTYNMRYMYYGYRYAIRCKIPVMNVSSGGYEKDYEEEKLVRMYIKSGGKLYASAGNQRNNFIDKPFYPAALDGVIAVGAKKCFGKKEFSNYGGKIIYKSGCSYDKLYQGTSYSSPRAAAEEK